MSLDTAITPEIITMAKLLDKVPDLLMANPVFDISYLGMYLMLRQNGFAEAMTTSGYMFFQLKTGVDLKALEERYNMVKARVANY